MAVICSLPPLAVSVGFEPTEGEVILSSLANYRLKPLDQLTILGTIVAPTNIVKYQTFGRDISRPQLQHFGLRGFVSGLPKTHPTIPLNAIHLRCPRRIGSGSWI